MNGPGALYADPVHVEDVSECVFYHFLDIPGFGSVEGMWDLRGGEDDYLGQLALNGSRVLEVGPASGGLTFHMEARGAEVVAVELGPSDRWDNVPHARVDIAALRAEFEPVMDSLRRGFWFAHERFGSRAKVHHGRANALPAELGRFDAAVLGCVLLHTRDPLAIVEACARQADTIVITDMYYPELDGLPVARLFPELGTLQTDTWWQFAPELFVRYLPVLGYESTTVTYHAQRYKYDDFDSPMPLFTVVGSRSADGAQEPATQSAS